MNKKLTILIVAIECIFAVFLVSIFGPMIEALHAKILVADIYFVDEDGERIENDADVFVDLDVQRSYHYSFVLEPSDATNKEVFITASEQDPEKIEIEPDANGKGFTVHFLTKNVSSVKVTVRAKDTSQREAVITINKRLTDIEIGDDF